MAAAIASLLRHLLHPLIDALYCCNLLQPIYIQYTIPHHTLSYIISISMPSSKKKGKGNKGKGKSKGSSASSAAGTTKPIKPPRTNDEIIGMGRIINENHPPKKSLIRELHDALLYEVNSESRTQIIEQVKYLEDPDGDLESAGEDMVMEKVKVKMPITYETKEMMDFPGSSMLTVGRTSPFHVEKVYHNKPLEVIQHYQNINDEESLSDALKWTGEDPVINVLFPQLKLSGKDSIVFLGECYLDKECLAHFAGRFHSSNSNYKWPGSNAVLQCPFTCTMAVPGTKDEAGKYKRYIMIMQNIRQMSFSNGSLHSPHRGLPRLCDKEYFEKNFRGGLENVETEECRKVNAEWCQWPNILEEGICFRAAKKILPAGSASMATSSANFLPSAYTLFNFYHQCGMGAAV